MNKEKKYDKNDIICNIERELRSEIFELHAKLAGEFKHYSEQTETAIEIGNLASAIKSLSKARLYIMGGE